MVAADGAGPVEGYGLTLLVLRLVCHAVLLEFGYLTGMAMVPGRVPGYADWLFETLGCEIISLTHKWGVESGLEAKGTG